MAATSAGALIAGPSSVNVPGTSIGTAVLQHQQQQQHHHQLAPQHHQLPQHHQHHQQQILQSQHQQFLLNQHHLQQQQQQQQQQLHVQHHQANPQSSPSSSPHPQPQHLHYQPQLSHPSQTLLPHHPDASSVSTAQRISYLPRPTNHQHSANHVNVISGCGQVVQVVNTSLSSGVVSSGQSHQPHMVVAQQHQQQLHPHQHHQEQHQQNPHNHQLHQTPQQNVAQLGPNVASGWRRHISNGDIIYISPSGAVLRNIDQIKDYLLSPGTCKCGLPCPLRPEYLFDFNSQAPNFPLDENAAKSSTCLHQAKQPSSPSIVLKEQPKKRKASTSWSAAPATATQFVPPNFSHQVPLNHIPNHHPPQPTLSPLDTIQSIHTVQPLRKSSSSNQPMSETTTSDFAPANTQTTSEFNSQTNPPSISVSRTPPWRRNSILIQQQQQQPPPQPTINPQSRDQSGGRVPPLPAQHMLPAQQEHQQEPPPGIGLNQQPETLPWQQEVLKRRPNVVIKKRTPTFIEDPSGYLDQQTTILKNSILNAQTPEGFSPLENSHKLRPETEPTNIQRQNMDNAPAPGRSRVIKSAMPNQHRMVFTSSGQPVRLVSNNHVVYSNSNMYPALESRQMQSPDITENRLPRAPFVFQSQQRMLAPQQVQVAGRPPFGGFPGTSGNGQRHQFPASGAQQQQQQHIQPPLVLRPPQGIQRARTKGLIIHDHQIIQPAHGRHIMEPNPMHIGQPSMQRIVEQSDEKIDEEERECDEEEAVDEVPEEEEEDEEEIATEKTQDINGVSIGGQTVTHLPNGMVQVHQNCDIAQMKHQQQLQLQQQIQQQHMLFRQQQQHQQVQQQLQRHVEQKQQQPQQHRTQQQIDQVIQQQNFNHLNNQQQGNVATSVVQPLRVVAASQESPVSSSTTYRPPGRADNRASPKGPAQVGAISTSNESPQPVPSPAASPEYSSLPVQLPQAKQPTGMLPKSSLVHGPVTGPKNTITSVVAGKSSTSTTSTNPNVLRKQRSHTLVKHQRSIDEAIHCIQQQHQQGLRLKNTSIGQPTQHIQQSQIIQNQMNQIQSQHQQPHLVQVSSGQVLQQLPSPGNVHQIQIANPNHQSRSVSSLVQNCVPVSSNMSGLQIQTIQRDNTNTQQQPQQQQPQQQQFIMTSSGQILLMPAQNTKPAPNQQMIISNANGQSIVMNHPPQMINTTDMVHGMQNQIEPQRHQMVIQGSNILPAQSNHLIQTSNNILTANNGAGVNQNFIVSSPNNMQQMILNNSHLIANHNNGIIQQHPSGQSITKVITNNGTILNAPNIITTNHSNQLSSNSLISPNGTVVLPNGYMLQQHQTFTTVDGQVVNLINQDSGSQFISQQQQAQQRIMLSPDSKRRAKKRKSSSGSPVTPTNSLSPQQSPSIQLHSPSMGNPSGTTTMLQITPQYQPQSFQISPGLNSGITLVQKSNNQQSHQPAQQQILLQNGQTLMQPLNLMGQQLLVPTGLMVAPDNTLLQIQNVAPCGSIITPQGMMLRAPSPQQNKNFLSPNQHGQQQPQQQQFIVNGNGQISPLGQTLYSTQMGLVVPQQQQQHLHNAVPNSGATYVQQNTTIVQQQTTMMGSNNGGGGGSSAMVVDQEMDQGRVNVHQSWPLNQMRSSQLQNRIDSPPDTTTHSPRSPERPSSQRSSGSDTNMVQCVSSSEPDAVVSPPIADSAHSPSHSDYDRSVTNIYQQQQNTYKPSDAKIRRIQYTGYQGSSIKMRPDSHESTPQLFVQQQHPHQQQDQSNQTTFQSSSSSSSSSSDSSPLDTSQPVPMVVVPTDHSIGANTSLPSPTNNSPPSSSSSLPPSQSSPTLIPATNPIPDPDQQTSASPPIVLSPIPTARATTTFAVNELVWGPARGHPAWPGKVVSPPDGVATPSDSTWVQWFGGRPHHIELVTIAKLKSLSEGLDAHHRAQKVTRKSRKLNPQLERAIQEAMADLDRRTSNRKPKASPASSTTSSTKPPQIEIQPFSTSSTSPTSTSKLSPRTRALRQPSQALPLRNRPVKIAPAPPTGINATQPSPNKTVGQNVRPTVAK